MQMAWLCAGTICPGPACRFDAPMAPVQEGSNIVTVSVKPQKIGVATSTRFSLKVENVADSFSYCEDNVLSQLLCSLCDMPWSMLARSCLILLDHGFFSALQKVCLGSRGLGGMWRNETANDLRASVHLQWICLKDANMPNYKAHAPVCNR